MPKITLSLVVSAHVLAACGGGATPTQTAEFTVTPVRPTPSLESGAATFEAMVIASATALKITADAPVPTSTPEPPPTVPPTAILEQPTETPKLTATDTQAPSTATATLGLSWGKRAKTVGCVASGGLPFFNKEGRDLGARGWQLWADHAAKAKK